MIVLDSFALLAYLREESGAEDVQKLLSAAYEAGQFVYMTEINYAETKYITIRKSGQVVWDKIEARLPGIPISFVPIDRELSDIAADMKAHHSMSIADACAAALAIKLNADLVTGDKEFKGIENKIAIQWIQ